MTMEHARTLDDGSIRKVISAWTDALRTKDIPGVVRHHAPDFVHFSLAPPLTSTGGDTAGLQAWFATWRGPIGYEMRDLAITAGDDAAFCHSLTRITGTRSDGEATDLWFRQTLGFRKVNGEWRITHEHESVPFYMDGSLKAAVDLEP
jgi:ketosteroid isomerase-like protein